MFNPGLKIGQVIRNEDIVEIFKCGNMGECAAQEQRIHWLSYLIIQKAFIMINGLAEFCIT